MSILDGVSLPYKPGESPDGTPPAPASPAPPQSGSILDGVNLPYKPGEQPTPAKTAPPGQSWTHAIWNSITGEDQPPVELQPRSLSQAGSDVADFGRVFGNKAGVPGSFDLIADAINGTDLATEQAKTEQARKNIGPVASGVADFMGQRASVLRATPWADNPLAQGGVTGGVGTFMQGGSWKDALTNAAADTGLSYAGQALGTGATALAKKAFDRSTQAVSSASSAALEDLQSLKQRGGDVAAAAEKYADSATDAAKAAYQKIADAARQSTETGPAQRIVAGALGHFLPGGELATAYIADPAIRAYNKLSQGLDVSHAIHQAYEPIAGAVKTAVDPDAWRSAIQNFAVSQGPTGPGTFGAATRFGPISWAKSLWPSSQ